MVGSEVRGGFFGSDVRPTSRDCDLRKRLLPRLQESAQVNAHNSQYETVALARE